MSDEEHAPARRPGRPARIDRDKIVEAVLASGDLDALTMREVAARLGVSHGALYRWVKDRDELLDLVSDVMVERVLPAEAPARGQLDGWLAALAWAMHDEFLAVPGFASRLARPHRHGSRAFPRLRDAVVDAFAAEGLAADLAEQNWYVFITALVSWLATQERPLELGGQEPDFALFLSALLAGLPVREPRPRA